MKYNRATMRYISLILGLCSLLAVVSCSKEVIVNSEPAEMVCISIVADLEGGTRLDVDGNKTYWEEGDKILLALRESSSSTTYSEMSINSASDISSDGKSAIFRGEVEARTYYSGVTALYPAQSVNFNEVTLNREDEDNIFMTSYSSGSFTASQGAKLPIAFEHLMHKMDFKLSIAEGESAVDLNSDITIKVSAKNNGSTVKFVKSKKLNMKDLSPTVMEEVDQLIVQGSGASFSTMLFPMELNDNGTLIFDVSVGGKQYEIVKGPFNQPFKMSAGKSTTVNLVLGDEGGNTGGGQTPAPTDAIKLTASVTNIKANGIDATTFTVTQDGANVTDLSTIYVNESILNGNRFITTTPGTYTVYAVKGEQKSNELTITAEEVTSTGKTIVFAEGVTLTSGWYDVNKKAQGNNGDINMCWAATSSNMIQWFQDRYKAAGKTLPASAVDGPGVTSYTNYGPYELELMNVFHSEWDNSRGGHMQEAIPWYFEGKLNGGEFASAGSQAVPLTEGGYWKSIWDTEVYPYIYHGYENVIVPGVEGLDLKNLYITIFNNYYLWGNGTSYLGVERLEAFSNLIVESFRYGMAGLTVNLGANLNAVSHAVTLWGYEIDNATGLVTRLWITDSDDLLTEPKTPLLNEYSVSIDEGKSHIKLTGNTRYGACYVVSIHPFAGYGSATSSNGL